MIDYKAFESWLFSRRNVNAATVAQYACAVRSFYAFSGDGPVTARAARRWFMALHDAGKSIPAKANALNMWCGFLLATGRQPDAPYKMLPSPKASGRHVRADMTDIINAHAAPKGDSDKYVLGRACMMLLYSSLIRPSEIAAMTWSQVDFYESTVTIGGEVRPIHAAALNALADWYKRISPVARGPFVPVVTLDGGYTGLSVIAAALKAVDPRLTPSAVRESAIHGMIAAGGEVLGIAQIAGMSAQAVARRLGSADSLRSLKNQYMRNHPHAEAME